MLQINSDHFIHTRDVYLKVIDLRPTVKLGHKSTKPRPHPSKASPDGHPTGLVTSMGGTVVKDGLTTVHETSVLGTYISGKYAQVLQSTSHVYQSQVPRFTILHILQHRTSR